MENETKSKNPIVIILVLFILLLLAGIVVFFIVNKTKLNIEQPSTHANNNETRVQESEAQEREEEQSEYEREEEQSEYDNDFEKFVNDHTLCINLYCDNNPSEHNDVEDESILKNIKESQKADDFTFVGSNDRFASVVYDDKISYLIDINTKEVVYRYDPGKNGYVSVYDFYKDFIIRYTVPFEERAEYVAGVYTKDAKEIILENKDNDFFDTKNEIYFYDDLAYVLVNNKLTTYDSTGKEIFKTDKKVLKFNNKYFVYYENGNLYYSDYESSVSKQIGDNLIKDIKDYMYVDIVEDTIYVSKKDSNIEKNKGNFSKYCASFGEYDSFDKDSYEIGYEYSYYINENTLDKRTMCFHTE